MKFRQLTSDEIKCASYANKGGVLLLLYKDARADMKILDETAGEMNWKKEFRSDHSCVVSIYDENKQEWISKEDLGEGQDVKSRASDAFKRACVNWGIGRALYKSPEIFIPAAALTKHTVERNPETGEADCYCKNTFRVEEVYYSKDESSVERVVIGIYEGKRLIKKLTFPNEENKIPKEPSVTPPVAADAPEKKTAKPAADQKANQNQGQPAQQPKAETVQNQNPGNSMPENGTPPQTLFADDEILLIGNCRGERYGDVAKTEKFHSFLQWVKTASCNYPDEARVKQMKKLKRLVELMQAS